jgi:hypothetical protein
LLCLDFNVTKTRFVVGTNERILVYATDDCKCKFIYDKVEGGVKHAMIMNEGGLTFFVGTGQNKDYPPKFLNIVYQPKNEKIASFGFPFDIQRIIPRNYLLCVICNDIINIFTINQFTKCKEYEIEPGTKDCVLISNDQENPILIYADKRNIGHFVLVMFKVTILSNQNDGMNEYKLEQETTLQIPAHKNKIRKMILNPNNKQVATCSHHGTLIRIFDTKTGLKLQELRRGSTCTEIIDMCYSPEGNYLAVISLQCTLHIYSIHANGKVLPDNPGTTLKFLSPILPTYFASEWSFAQIRIEDSWIQSGLQLAFGKEDTSLILIIKNGKYVKYIIKPDQKRIDKYKEDYWYNPII